MERVGDYTEEQVRKFNDRFPGYYDYIVDMVETLKQEDFDLVLRVMVIEWIRQHPEGGDMYGRN